MARCDTTERIAASPSRIWAWFTPAGLSDWFGLSVEPLDATSLSKGARLRIGGQYEATVTDCAPNRMLIWEGREPSGTVHRVSFTLNPREGSTTVLLREEFHRSGAFGRLLERLSIGGTAKRGQRALSRLKGLSEKG